MPLFRCQKRSARSFSGRTGLIQLGRVFFVGLKDNFQVKNKFSASSLGVEFLVFFRYFFTFGKKVVFNIRLLLESKYVYLKLPFLRAHKRSEGAINEKL